MKTKPKTKEVKGCACYGNNSIHPCFCLPHNDKKYGKSNPKQINN